MFKGPLPIPSSMDITDEQWEAGRSSIPEPERQGTTE
jgi:hypothetical protein